MTRAAEKPWTADQDAILISMAVDADSWDAVAGVLGRGVGSIRGRAHKLGLRLNAAKVHARRKANVAAAVQRLDVRAKTAAACKLSWTPERRMQASARAKANDSIQFALAKPCEEAARIAAIARHWSKWR
jgi:hypothetical protein